MDDRLYQQQQQDWDWTSETSRELSSSQPQLINSEPAPKQNPGLTPGQTPGLTPVLTPGYPPAGASAAYGPPPVYPPAANLHYPQVTSLGAAPGYPPQSPVAPAYPYGSSGQEIPETTDRNTSSAGKDQVWDWSQLKNKIKRPFERISSKIQQTFQTLSQRADGGSSLPSMSRMRYEIKAALGLPQTLTSLSPSADPDPGPGPGILDNLESLTNQKLKRVNQALKNFISNSNEILKLKTEQTSSYQTPYQTSAYQTSYDSSEKVTPSPIPVPIPTYLPVRKNGEFSAGFQVLMQYVAAMVGVAMVLLI